MAGEKHHDEYRPPTNWRRRLWMEYLICIVVVFAAAYAIFWLIDHLVQWLK